MRNTPLTGNNRCFPFTSRCLDQPCGPCRIGLEARISQRITESVGLRRRRQGLAKHAHEVIVNCYCPVALTKPPALWRAL